MFTTICSFSLSPPLSSRIFVSPAAVFLEIVPDVAAWKSSPLRLWKCAFQRLVYFGGRSTPWDLDLVPLLWTVGFCAGNIFGILLPCCMLPPLRRAGHAKKKNWGKFLARCPRKYLHWELLGRLAVERRFPVSLFRECFVLRAHLENQQWMQVFP